LAPGVNGSSTTTSTRTSPEEAWDPEDIIRNYAGLKKGDFAMIQEKLVSVARTTEHRGSAMRKRRPSTSQSNYSVRDNRVSRGVFFFVVARLIDRSRLQVPLPRRRPR
jgi:F420-0:gamma-glutamyl ligase-like protein